MARLPLSPLAFGLLAAGVALLDQITKLAVLAAHLVGPAPVIPGVFDLLYRENHGGAWGLLTSAPEWFRMPFFAGSSLAAIVFLVWLRRRMAIRRRWVDLAFPAILGGAAGNLIDRLRLGHVVDFLDLHVGRTHWPTFNVADIGITVGVVLLVADSLFAARAAPAAPTSTTEPPAPAPTPTETGGAGE